jgi:hypothetical protein
MAHLQLQMEFFAVGLVSDFLLFEQPVQLQLGLL